MISTITTSTISTVTLAGSFAVFGILLLIGLLIQKHLTSAGMSDQAKKLTRVLNIGIAPLLIVFVLVVVSKIAANLK